MRQHTHHRLSFGQLENLEIRRVLSVDVGGIGQLVPIEPVDVGNARAIPVNAIPTVADAFVGSWSGAFFAEGKGLIHLTLTVKEVVPATGAVAAAITLSGCGYDNAIIDVNGTIGIDGNFMLTWQRDKDTFGELWGRFNAGKETIEAHVFLCDTDRSLERSFDMGRAINVTRPDTATAAAALLPEGTAFSQKGPELIPIPNLALELVGAWHCDFIADGKDPVCFQIRAKDVTAAGDVTGTITIVGLGYDNKTFEMEGIAGPRGRFTFEWQEGKNSFGRLVGAYHAGYEGLVASVLISTDGRYVTEELLMSRGEHEMELRAGTSDAEREILNVVQWSPFARKAIFDEGAARVFDSVDLKA
jgi:hypothetical protein